MTMRAALAVVAACLAWPGATAVVLAATTVEINPGGPPSVVIDRIGATPKISARVDPTAATFKPDPALAALGKRIFFDTRLSQPQGTSCASCHDPLRAFTSTLNAPSLAGPRTPQGSRPGHFSARTAPSLLYVRYVPHPEAIELFQQEGRPDVVEGGMLAGKRSVLRQLAGGHKALAVGR